MISGDALSRFERMLTRAYRIRAAEERIIDLYSSDLIQSPVHLSIGQEMVAVAICDPLRHTDILFPTYRSHAFYMAKGGNLNSMFAELYGRIDGVCSGKAGSMHLAAPEVGLMGASAVVASNLPHAAGAALAAQMDGSDQVVVCVFGDGATEEGVYHETLNFIALHKLPILLICENNGLAAYTDLATRQSFKIPNQASLYGITTQVIENANHMEVTADIIASHVNEIRNGEGPVFLEIHTARYKEHVGVGDDFGSGYRDEAEMSPWYKSDPILNNPEFINKISPSIAEELDLACAYAAASPAPGIEHLLQDVI